jgi:hypothetical protein
MKSLSTEELQKIREELLSELRASNGEIKYYKEIIDAKIQEWEVLNEKFVAIDREFALRTKVHVVKKNEKRSKPSNPGITPELARKILHDLESIEV